MEQGTALPVLELLEVGLDTPAEGTEAQMPPSRRRPGLAAASVAAVVVVVVVAGVVIWSRTSAPAPAVGATQIATTPVTEATLPPPGIEGFAEMYLAAYLTGEAGLPLHIFYAAAPEPAPGAATRFVRQIATLGVAATGDGTWDVRMAADVLVHDGIGYQPEGVRHFVVGVVETPSGPAATGLPVLIPPPPPAPIPAANGEAPIEDTSLWALAEGFLAAYLAGDGDLRAFVAPASDLAALAPPPFAAVTIDELHGTPRGDGTLWLRSRATATDEHGNVVVEHHLVVTASGGTWLVTSLATGRPLG